MKRNKFSLSHYKLLSCDMGELVPVSLIEVLPGDTFQAATNALIRAAPMLSPVMHPTHATFHWWYVPYRLIWDDFEEFITGGPDGMDASAYPTLTINPAVGTLADYLGLGTGSSLNTSALPFRAYAKIWNENYRDQDLQTPLVIDVTSGADTTTSVALQNVCWEKDYFTSARPWEQKGPAVTLPLGTTAPVRRVGTTGAPTISQASGAGQQNQPLFGQAGDTIVRNASGNWSASEQLKWGTTIGLETDLSAAASVTVNTLREALAIQRYEENRARYGSRYVEYLRYYGIRSSDARLQRPEYLGGGRQTIQFSEVLQTGVTTSGNAAGVGTLRGHGIGAMRTNRWRRFFEEHGVIMCLMNIKPKTMYFQGARRLWNRRTKEDFYQRELENLGQQEILNKEVFTAHTTPDGVFGYQDRYDEYRREESSVGGEFRTTLNFWHMARDFGASPALNDTFVKSVPTERTFAVPSEDVMYVMANHSIQARRMLSKFSKSMTF